MMRGADVLAIGPRQPRRAWLLAAALAAAGLAAQAPEPSVVFLSPHSGDYTSGPTPIRVQVDPPGTAVSSLSLFADGRLVCTLDHPPFECAFDAGPNVVEHALRAVATLPGGRRIAQSVRTQGVAYTESVDVDVVQVTVTVTDGAGRFVRGLTRQDFRLFEDNVRQDVTTFIAENVPTELIVAVDVSGSMTDAMPNVKESVKRFLSAIRPTDRVTVLGFNDSVFTLARPTVDLAARLRAIDRLAPWGGTALYDVIIQAFDLLGRQTGRRALVVFTDGEDLNSRAPIETAERRLEASDAVMYPIGQGRAQKLQSLRAVLERLSRKSGGRAFFGDDVEKLDGVFGDILEELSNQYLLGYVPRDLRRDGRWRILKVEVPGKELRVRARQGYRAEPKK
ncbi:MAG TPA: VWA domain-containing protein [Vicinamibacterales bacterium]|nr:VWA domain-containing protein [Vicinamibacterales bacterium]HOQ61310.1 VWA domain-containing protein [Vicinamibacterales bacterium]